MYDTKYMWCFLSLATYHVSKDMSMVRHKQDGIRDLPAEAPSGGLNGEAFAGQRSVLISLLSKMKTEEPAELSLLSYMCAESVVVNKCSTGNSELLLLDG